MNWKHPEDAMRATLAGVNPSCFECKRYEVPKRFCSMYTRDPFPENDSVFTQVCPSFRYTHPETPDGQD